MKDNFVSKTTDRGFVRVEFLDANNVACSLQESSQMGEPLIWLGPNEASPRFLAESDTPHQTNVWVKFPYDRDRWVFDNRMHLNQEQAKKLIDRLKRFVETGTL